MNNNEHPSHGKEKSVNNLKTHWFNPMGGGCIGVVLYENAEGIEKSYIGVASGVSLTIDANLIIDRGAKFPVKQAKQLML